MKAVGLYKYLPITHSESLIDVEIAKPQPEPHDLLVKIAAISVNPVDIKVRSPKSKIEQVPRILGWDAVGIVEAVGSAVSLFKPGDRVFYAGDITRPGSNAEYQLVDERIVGRAPTSVSLAQAAALPLTAITAYEALFDRLMFSPNGEHAGQSLLIIGGAGGVGSIAIQLAKKLAKLKVIATASRPESREWVKQQGADYVINHFENLSEQLTKLQQPEVNAILILNNTDQYFPLLEKLIAPQGKIASIVETSINHNLDGLKSKSATFAWEFMFTRSMYQTSDMIAQHHMLNVIADAVDAGIIKTTMAQNFGTINANNVKRAHRELEQGHVIGKIVLAGFE